MLIIPAIDLKGGKCVRLRQGKPDEETVFSDDPIGMAEHWAAQGARRLHIIDLDGAARGEPTHLKTVAEIARRLPKMPIQVGGGIREEDTVQAYLDCGVQYVIIGTRAVAQPHFVNDLCLEFPGHIIVGLDVRDGRVATAGWSKLSHHDPIDLAQQFESDGVAAIVHTNIHNDGMMSGLDLAPTTELAAAIHIPVIAAGGVRSLDDIRALCAVDDDDIVGAITGRALYEGAFDFAAAQQLADELRDR